MIGLDTNILVYAVSADGDPQVKKARRILDRLFLLAPIVPVQVLGEFMNVVHRKRPIDPSDAARRIEEWLPLFRIPPTQPADLIDANRLCIAHRLQFFDGLICVVARREGAEVLLSEDMQDGSNVSGLTILNPFAVANDVRLENLLSQ